MPDLKVPMRTQRLHVNDILMQLTVWKKEWKGPTILQSLLAGPTAALLSQRGALSSQNLHEWQQKAGQDAIKAARASKLGHRCLSSALQAIQLTGRQSAVAERSQRKRLQMMSLDRWRAMGSIIVAS